MSAITRPTIGQSVHSPPNQRWTAEYQSSVVGRKMKPTIGQRIESNMPHAGRAGPEGAVVVDVFSPPRGDWEAIAPGEAQQPLWP